MDNQQEQDEWASSPINCEGSASLFNKIRIKYDNQTIENRLNQVFSKPMHYVEDPQRQISDGQQQKQGHTTPKNENQQSQALYNPLQDDDNEVWMRKLREENPSQKSTPVQSKIKPLICPACFAQIAFQYYKQYDQQKPQYRATAVFSIVVKENLIMRNKNCSEKMQQNVDSAQILLKRQQQFNVKIICDCECGVPIGYYDVNRQDFVLSNVI